MVGRLWGLLVLGSMVAAFGLATPAGAQTKKLGVFGGWEISMVYEKGKFVRCVADTTGPGNEGLRMSFGDDGQRQFILPGPGTAGARDEAAIVFRPSGKRFTFPMAQRSPDRLWSPALENSFTDVFFESKRMEVQLPARNVSRSFDLGDPDTMSARIDGCMISHQ
ncbi:MAG: hypothetical protein FD144_4739 [Rhodospirillaceae bacterium]|nr:MAG: hypothetical protein FD144_4739 [Rhodospirillaceae bacterium]